MELTNSSVKLNPGGWVDYSPHSNETKISVPKQRDINKNKNVLVCKMENRIINMYFLKKGDRDTT